MVIQQPSGQIKLTNVSLVRLRKERKRFEVACYQNKVQDYRKGIEKDMDEVLQIHQVFMNVSKGLVASKEDLLKCFGTSNVDDIIKLILQKGEIQLSEKERQIMLNKINNEMLTIISAKCINPKSKKRYPPTMIHKALVELKFSPVVGKASKLQALEAIKLLIAKQIIPIVRAKMEVKVNIQKPLDNKEALEKVQKLIIKKQKETDVKDNETSYECTGLIDPVSYRDIVTLCSQIGSLQVLDMAVIDEGNN